MLVGRGQQRSQSLDLSHYRLVMDEIQLAKVVELMHEELQVTGLFGEDQAPLLFCDSIVMHEQAESAVRDWVAANVVQGDGNAPLLLLANAPHSFPRCQAASRVLGNAMICPRSAPRASAPY
jgi:hypothetical protein